MRHHLCLLDLVQNIGVELLIIFVQLGHYRVLRHWLVIVLRAAVVVIGDVFLVIGGTVARFARTAFGLACLGLSPLVLCHSLFMAQSEGLWDCHSIFFGVTGVDMLKLGRQHTTLSNITFVSIHREFVPKSKNFSLAHLLIFNFLLLQLN
jgi:hypothetical protein